ncbi:BglG family transcription antiterminator [Alkaliphilus peptidifermentans]|uniref:Transcriptional antiterminator n=1 Tax=Alkaliphilus peptidifermentans DSM 18978 TaxID=1120976 RepID=A0A1G5KPA8_9FIRM|nr:BglG family transcription antiterminator [Alkaliphilus peptidifermentans]SCZ01779.1 Transcriptional antiterminator [Alkaliphilus peptidifermentans DSM 18978]
MISSRQKKIMEQLVHNQDYMTVEELSKKFNVSQRTIRHDILMLESSLKDKDIFITRNRKFGLKLDIDSEKWQQVQSFIDEKIEYLSPESRSKEIAKELLEKSEVAFDDLIETFKISDKTLISDLADLKAWFNMQNLKLIREKGKVKISGRELYRRKAYLYLIKEEASGEKILDYLLYNDSKIMNVLQWKRWFQPKDMHYLFEVVSELEETLSIVFSDNGYVALILHIYLSLERLKKEHFVAMDEKLLTELRQTEEFETAEKIVKLRIEPYFGIKLPLTEIGYITQHILTAQKEYKKDQEDKECLELAKKIVIEAERSFKKPLLTSRRIIESLAMHLKPAIYRSKYNIKICNPLFSELQQEYKELLETILQITNEVLAPKGVQFDQQEASYIAMHIGAGIEQRPVSPIKRIAIVCSSGLGTVNILQRRLLDIYPQVNIVKKCSYKDLKDLTLKEVDLVISTIDIYYNLSMPWIKVSPLLTRENERKITELLGIPDQREAKELQYINTVNEVIKIVEKSSDIKNRSKLYKELIQLFKGNNSFLPISYSEGTIAQLLPEESIVLMADPPSTVEEMIGLGTAPLKKRGLIGIEYEEKLIEMIKNPSHHFVITEGIIFPHASNKLGVWGTGFSLVTFNKPVVLKEVRTSIEMMITMAAVDNKKHVDVLAMLIDALNNESFLNLLKNTYNSLDIYDWFQKREGNLL